MWDPEILAIELRELIALDADFDVTVTGFELPEIDLILQDANPKQAGELLHLEDLNGPAVSRLGDLWRLGKHRVLCGGAALGNPRRN